MSRPDDPEQLERWTEEFWLGSDDTLADVLALYEDVAPRTDELVRTLPDLDADQPLPAAPRFGPGGRSVRRVLLHIVAETAQHADMLRESVDGRKTMG